MCVQRQELFSDNSCFLFILNRISLIRQKCSASETLSYRKLREDSVNTFLLVASHYKQCYTIEWYSQNQGSMPYYDIFLMKAWILRMYAQDAYTEMED